MKQPAFISKIMQMTCKYVAFNPADLHTANLIPVYSKWRHINVNSIPLNRQNLKYERRTAEVTVVKFIIDFHSLCHEFDCYF